MEDLDLNSEWEFIQNEVHKKNFKKHNYLKRELLFLLQCLLIESIDEFSLKLYFETKSKYLSS